MPWSGWVTIPDWLTVVITGWFAVSAAYTVALQVTMAALAVAAHANLRAHRPELRPGRAHTLAADLHLPGVSVIVPAHNEGPVIVPTVRALLSSDYPNLELIVVNDGSTDDTLAHLIDAFTLAPVTLPDEDHDCLRTATVHGEYRPLGGPRLRVLNKDAGGCKADAANAGVAAATQPLLLVVDGDGLLDRHAISRAVAAFREAGPGAVAAGGTILPVNDCHVDGSAVTRARVPRKFVAACQLLEYLRSFVIGRAGLAQMGAVSLVSGAFGLFRTADVRAVGGFTVGHLGEDLDLTIRLLRWATVNRPGYQARVVQVPDAVLWTEVPSTWKVLRNQRIRWHRGLVQALREHTDMIGRPRWGGVGLIGMPQLAVFELAAPLVQAAGVACTALLLALGVFDPVLGSALIGASLLAGLLSTSAALWCEEVSLRHYLAPRDVGRLIAVAMAEQLVYQPVTVWWRVKATFMGGRPVVWGEMTRTGFGAASA